MTDIAPRPATMADAAVIAELHRECFAETGQPVWDQNAIAAILAMPGAFGCLALASAGPAGFALGRIAADEAEILAVGVVFRLRRQGLGRRLIEDIATRAVAAGAARLLLEVAASDDTARALYTRIGFIRIGKRPGYYALAGGGRGDALVMRLDLNNPHVTVY